LFKSRARGGAETQEIKQRRKLTEDDETLVLCEARERDLAALVGLQLHGDGGDVVAHRERAGFGLVDRGAGHDGGAPAEAAQRRGERGPPVRQWPAVTSDDRPRDRQHHCGRAQEQRNRWGCSRS
jgi:hypothetical protein